LGPKAAFVLSLPPKFPPLSLSLRWQQVKEKKLDEKGEEERMRETPTWVI
jgi:hypothetical protein